MPTRYQTWLLLFNIRRCVHGTARRLMPQRSMVEGSGAGPNDKLCLSATSANPIRDYRSMGLMRRHDGFATIKFREREQKKPRYRPPGTGAFSWEEIVFTLFSFIVAFLVLGVIVLDL